MATLRSEDGELLLDDDKALKLGTGADGELVYDSADDRLELRSSKLFRIETDVTITGDLTVSGTTTTVGSENLTVEDNIILLNEGETGSGVTEGTSGLEIDRGSLSNAQLVFDESNDRWSTSVDAGATLTPLLGRSGTPADNQLAVFANANDVEGDSNLTWDGSTLDVNGAADFLNAVILQTQATATDHAVAGGRTLTGGDGIAAIGDLTADRTISVDLASSAGLKFITGQLAVEPADFAGTFLSDDGADNLTVDIGRGLENDGSGNIRVDEDTDFTFTAEIDFSAGLSTNDTIHAASDSAIDIGESGSEFQKVWVDNIGSSGSTTLNPAGDIITEPAGGQMRPSTTDSIDIGTNQNRYRQINAAELLVQTIVAQDTKATIGGRILVGPTATLKEDLDTTETTITVSNNGFDNGDIVVLEVEGNIEYMSIDSGATANGDNFDYTVTRDLDGSGANTWDQGDAVFSTGQTGQGFIDIYSTAGIDTGTGPTITGNVRQSSTYNDWVEGWAIGNLDGEYGFGADTYGIGLGEYKDGNTHITVDDTNGIRIRERSGGVNTTIGQWDVGGDITLGKTSASNANLFWDVSAGELLLRSGTTSNIKLATDGTIVAGSTSNDVVVDGSVPSIALGGTTSYTDTTGIWMGDDGGTFKFRIGDNSTPGDYLSYDGSQIEISGTFIDEGNSSIQGTTEDTFTINKGDATNPTVSLVFHRDAGDGTLSYDGNFSFTTGKNLTIGNDLLASGGEVIWDESATHIPQARLQNDTVTVAGNAVSLGGSTTVNHSDLSNIGASDHHARYTDEEAQDATGAMAGTGLTYTDATPDLSVTLSPFSTSDLSEGSNLYFTDERAQDAVGNNVGTGLQYDDPSGSVSVDPATVPAVGSVDGVSNDGGNIDLVPGTGINITPDDTNNDITFSFAGDETASTSVVAATTLQDFGGGTRFKGFADTDNNGKFDSSEGDTMFPLTMPRAGKVKSITVFFSGSDTADDQHVVTLQKNSTDTALSVTFDGSAEQTKTDTGSISVAVEDKLRFKIEETAGTTGGGTNIAMFVEIATDLV